MTPIAIMIQAVSMSVDAFAAALGCGATAERTHWGDAMRAGAVFGLIEAITPMIGWAAGTLAAGFVTGRVPLRGVGVGSSWQARLLVRRARRRA